MKCEFTYLDSSTKDSASIFFPKYLHENHLPVEKKYIELLKMIKNKKQNFIYDIMSAILITKNMRN